MKIFIKALIIIGATVLFSGCASNEPTSKVGIVNGRYAVQTTVTNNNKGKKVNLTAGQNYNCEKSYLGNDGKQHRITFDLKVSEDGQNITWYNDKRDGVTPEGYYIGHVAFKPGLGFVETTKGKQAFIFSKNNSGAIAVFASMKDREKFTKLMQRFQNGEITKSEADNSYKKQKIRSYNATCTQTTNNIYTQTRYLTDHEIREYQYNRTVAQNQKIANRNYWNSVSANTNMGSFGLGGDTFTASSKNSSAYQVNRYGNVYNVQKLGDSNIQF